MKLYSIYKNTHTALRSSYLLTDSEAEEVTEYGGVAYPLSRYEYWLVCAIHAYEENSIALREYIREDIYYNNGVMSDGTVELKRKLHFLSENIATLRAVLIRTA